MIRAHKIRLHPTPEQANYCAKAAGTSRFVWNWALGEWNRQYKAGEKPTALGLKKQFNEIRREQFPWTWEVTKNASDQPFLDLGKAFTAFFQGLKNGKRKGRPKFKSKKRSKPSFYLANDQFELGDHRVWVPKLGWVNMAENLRFQGKVTGARITKTADWWFISISVEVPDAPPDKRGAAVGIDVGLNRLATLSTAEGYENQAFLKTALLKLRQANKRLHRRKPGSKNREKARRQVARLHYQITCLPEEIPNSRLATLQMANYALAIFHNPLPLTFAAMNRRSPLYRAMVSNPGTLLPLDPERVYARNLEVPSGGGVERPAPWRAPTASSRPTDMCLECGRTPSSS